MFVWFGALKVANVTPVATLVADTLAFVPLPSTFVLPALGVFEIAAGLALIAGALLVAAFLPPQSALSTGAEVSAPRRRRARPRV